jgi:hypothetical protein
MRDFCSGAYSGSPCATSMTFVTIGFVNKTSAGFVVLDPHDLPAPGRLPPRILYSSQGFDFKFK